MPNGPQSKPATRTPVDDITWLEAALFARPGELITRSTRRASSVTDMTWAALPVRGTTRRLVPTSHRFAAEAFTNHHDAMSPTRRTLGRIVRTAVHSGALRFAPQLRADTNVVFADPDQSVIAAAAIGLGQTIGSCAITLGPQRYNRKPVVQLMDHDARTIGFLKVGADAMTSAMVATEALAIDGLLRPTIPVLEVPSVLWRSEWNGYAVACFSPVASDGLQLVPADQSRLVELAAAIIEAGGGHADVELRGCAPVERLRSEVSNGHHDEANELLDRVEAAFGNHTVSLGPWHGDFSPWNMISNTDSTALIDWEFAGHDMPLGSDLLHNRVMVATHLSGDPAQRPLQQLLDFGRDIPELHAMVVASNQHRPHLLLYLLELMRRDFELKRLGLPATGFGEPAEAIAKVILTEARSQ